MAKFQEESLNTQENKEIDIKKNLDNVKTKDDFKAPEELTKKDYYIAWMRWWWINTVPQSVERFLAPALLWTMVPILKKLYKNEDDLRAAYKRQLLFFNTQLSLGGGIIIGLMSSMEQERARQEHENLPIEMTDDLMYNTKAGLMGALAGIGDSIDSGTIQFIFIAIALPWAASGLAIGALFPFLAFSLYQFLIGFYFTKQGFTMGRSAATFISGQKMQSAIELLSILGLFMMGILGANFVNVESTIRILLARDIVEGQPYYRYFDLQQTLNTILPGLLPLAVVMGVYFFFVKKGLKVTKALLWLTLILGSWSVFEIIIMNLIG